MSREPLLSLLRAHRTDDPSEHIMLANMIRFVEDHADCFERSLSEGHVTAAAWIVNHARTHVVLMHHYKLDKWLQPGGHCDGDPDVIGVAMREAFEETGLRVTPAGDGIFDLDIHSIPARRNVPGHLHYDVRFLMVAEKGEADELPNNHESHAVRWISLDDIPRYTTHASILRMVQKTNFIAT